MKEFPSSSKIQQFFKSPSRRRRSQTKEKKTFRGLLLSFKVAIVSAQSGSIFTARYRRKEEDFNRLVVPFFFCFLTNNRESSTEVCLLGASDLL